MPWVTLSALYEQNLQHFGILSEFSVMPILSRNGPFWSFGEELIEWNGAAQNIEAIKISVT